MGLSVSGPLRQKSKRSDKPRKSSAEVCEMDPSSCYSSTRSSAITFQNQLWAKRSKQRSSRREIDDNSNYHETQVYATLQTASPEANPEYINLDNKYVSYENCSKFDVKCNEVTGNVDSSVKRTLTCLPQDSMTSKANYYTDDCKASTRSKPQSRSSLSSVYTKLPPLPEPDEAEKEEELNEKECKGTANYSSFMDKDTNNEYTMTSCIDRPDPLLNTHAYTSINQISACSDLDTNSETAREDGCTADGVEMQESGCNDEILHREATMHSGDVGTDEEEEASHGIVSSDPDCDPMTLYMSMREKKSPICEYEPYPDGYGYGRTTSYKYGKLLMNPTNPTRVVRKSVNPVPNLRKVRHPSKPLTTIPHASQPQPLQPSQQAIVQPSQLSPDQPLQASPVQSNPISNNQIHAGFDVYRVYAGSQQRLPQMTVSVPPRIDSGASFVELRWSYNPDEYPVPSAGQRHLTNVLHCLPHGSTFTSPVVIALDLPLTEGQIEFFYSPTDVYQTPAWKKLRAIDAPANTRFTDDHQPFANKVLLLLKNRRQAVLTLRHFCSFAVVENRNVVLPRKAEVAIFLKTETRGENSSIAIFKVAVGCDKSNMHRRFQTLKDEGFRMIEKTGFLLYKTESDSELEVGIRDIEWIFGCMGKQSPTSRVHSLDCLWSGIEATSLFWMMSKESKLNEDHLSCTVYVHQDGCLEKQIGIYCDMKKEPRMTSRPRRTVAATPSSPALLASVGLRTSSDSRNPSSDSDLSLVTEDPSSRRHDEEATESDRDFELTYHASDKSVIREAVYGGEMLSKRFHSVENKENAGINQHGPVLSLAKSLANPEYPAEDVNRITTTVGGTVITQPELDWMLAA